MASHPGERRVPVSTPVGDFSVRVRQVGQADDLKVLLLHGGPAATHEYLECFDDWLPAAGVEHYQYDQLGSFGSDQPDDESLWRLDRFVDEVEQVRRALGLTRDTFVLYGQSWGGLLAIEYALHHQEHLKGLVVSNMMASIPAYNRYADETLKPEIDPADLAEIERLERAGAAEDDPRYMELLQGHYERHVLRRPMAEWPEPVTRSFAHINQRVYSLMQGPSELGASGVLADWDRTEDLASIEAPTLVMGATHDTMEPAHLAWMAEQLPHGSYWHCPDGSHLAMWDDQEVYMTGLITFLQELRGRG